MYAICTSLNLAVPSCEFLVLLKRRASFLCCDRVTPTKSIQPSLMVSTVPFSPVLMASVFLNALTGLLYQRGTMICGGTG